MSNNQSIQAPLYLRQRKALLSLAIVITVMNIIGGELITGDNGKSALILPLGVTFEIARPETLDWLFFIGLFYLFVRYIVFAKGGVKRDITEKRRQRNQFVLQSLEPSITLGGYRELTLRSRYWFWEYDVTDVDETTHRKLYISEGVKFSAWKSFFPSLRTELILLMNYEPYSDYYIPIVVTLIAALSFLL